MANADQIEVFPKGEGWRWRLGSQESKRFDTRAEAIEDALLEREIERVVLLRHDASEVGELYHASRRRPGPPQRIDILAAADREDAVNVDG